MNVNLRDTRTPGHQGGSLKIIHLNYSDIHGGAARAAYRVHRCLQVAGIDSRMWVDVAASGDHTVEGPRTTREKLEVEVRGFLGRQLARVLNTQNSGIRSPAALRSRWVRRINQSDADLVHLHWVAGEMLSVADIGRIQKPIVWTLHDMWAFCGAEHYTDELRWHEGYRSDNRPEHESGFDLNRWTWKRKRKHWRQPLQIVSPSRWLAERVRESVLMHEWPVRVVPNPIDTEAWQPLAQPLARELLGLPKDAPLLLFGAMGGGQDPRKGFDLLLQALKYLQETPIAHGMQLVVFGQHSPLSPPDLGFPVHYTGHLHDDLSLRALYAAADALVVPSRQDNLPNTCVEAQACGVPVVAFHTGGLPDLVAHRSTGYLAKAFDVNDLASGIAWVLGHGNRDALRENARRKAVEQFAYPVVAHQYRAVYDQALSIGSSGREPQASG